MLRQRSRLNVYSQSKTAAAEKMLTGGRGSARASQPQNLNGSSQFKVGIATTGPVPTNWICNEFAHGNPIPTTALSRIGLRNLCYPTSDCKYPLSTAQGRSVCWITSGFFGRVSRHCPMTRIFSPKTKRLSSLKALCCIVVPRKGLEPPHLSAPEPKSGAFTNFATWAGGRILPPAAA